MLSLFQNPLEATPTLPLGELAKQTSSNQRNLLTKNRANFRTQLMRNRFDLILAGQSMQWNLSENNYEATILCFAVRLTSIIVHNNRNVEMLS